MSYYDNSQWPAAGQSSWEHQTPPPARSGASSTIPREESAAFVYQIEEVDRAIDNLVKSGKMFGGMPGGRRESFPNPSPARSYPDFDARMASTGPRPHSIADYGDSRSAHTASNLQNFYATQRHQSSRGSNEAEQMMQAKRRMAAQRERDLRNYHQEQQYNRTVLAELSYNTKPDRTLSPGSMTEDERRELIARQRSALYGEGPFGESGGYIDETGTPRPGLPGAPNGPATTTSTTASMRGQSPLTYDYGRTPPAHSDAGPPPPSEGVQAVPQVLSGPNNERSRANSNSSPQSNPPSSQAVFNAPTRDASRTSASSPGGSPPRPGAPGSNKPVQNTVAPIGTRPSVTNPPANPALSKRSTTPLPSPLSQGFTVSGEESVHIASGAPSNPSINSAAADGPNVGGLSGWGSRPAVWGSKSGLGVQASVWG